MITVKTNMASRELLATFIVTFGYETHRKKDT
jgi:hypothetical protein